MSDPKDAPRPDALQTQRATQRRDGVTVSVGGAALLLIVIALVIVLG